MFYRFYNNFCKLNTNKIKDLNRIIIRHNIVLWMNRLAEVVNR